MDAFDYFMIGIGSFCAYLSYREIKKTNNHLRKDSIKTLNSEMDSDLEFLTQIPVESYVTLSEEEREFIDDLEEIIQMKREKYFGNKLAHLWEYVPRGEEKDKLREKAVKIKILLKKIPSDPLQYS